MKMIPFLLLLGFLQGSSFHNGMPLFPPVVIEQDYYLFQKEFEKDHYFFFPTHVVLEKEKPELFSIDENKGELVLDFELPFEDIELELQQKYAHVQRLLPQGNIDGRFFYYYDFLTSDEIEVSLVGHHVYLTFLADIEKYRLAQDIVLEGEIYFDHSFVQDFFIASVTLDTVRKPIASIYEKNDYSRLYLESAIQNIFYRKWMDNFYNISVWEKDAEELNQLTYPLTVMVNRDLVINKKIVFHFEIALKP